MTFLAVVSSLHILVPGLHCQGCRVGQDCWLPRVHLTFSPQNIELSLLLILITGPGASGPSVGYGNLYFSEVLCIPGCAALVPPWAALFSLRSRQAEVSVSLCCCWLSPPVRWHHCSMDRYTRKGCNVGGGKYGGASRHEAMAWTATAARQGFSSSVPSPTHKSKCLPYLMISMSSVVIEAWRVRL